MHWMNGKTFAKIHLLIDYMRRKNLAKMYWIAFQRRSQRNPNAMKAGQRSVGKLYLLHLATPLLLFWGMLNGVQIVAISQAFIFRRSIIYKERRYFEMIGREIQQCIIFTFPSFSRWVVCRFSYLKHLHLSLTQFLSIYHLIIQCDGSEFRHHWYYNTSPSIR